MWLEWLSAPSHCFTTERNGMGPKQALTPLSLLLLYFTSFLCSLMSFWGTFDLFACGPRQTLEFSGIGTSSS